MTDMSFWNGAHWACPSCGAPGVKTETTHEVQLDEQGQAEVSTVTKLDPDATATCVKDECGYKGEVREFAEWD